MADPFNPYDIPPVLFQTQGSIPFPNMQPDPALLERMKALALLRSGVGLMSREPAGNALGAGINTYVSGQEQARREALAQGQLAMEYQKLQAADLQERQQAALRARVASDPALLKALNDKYGPSYISMLVGSKDVAAAGIKSLENLTPTLSPGQVPQNLNGISVGSPDSNGNVTIMVPGQLPRIVKAGGYEHAMATQAAAEANAQLQKNLANAATTIGEYPVAGAPPGDKQAMTQLEALRRSGALGGALSPSRGGFSWKGDPKDDKAIAEAWRRYVNEDVPSQGGLGVVSPVSQAAATEAATGWQKSLVGLQNNSLESGMSAQSKIDKLNLLKEWYAKVPTSKIAPTVQAFKAYAAGIAPDMTKQWSADLPYAQASESIQKEMALQLRDPKAGGGLPGSMSDADREYLRSILPSLENDPRAIPLMVDMRIALERRNQEVMRKMLKYRKEKGGIDESFILDLEEWSNKNSIFKDLMPKVKEFLPGIENKFPQYYGGQ